MQWWAILGKDDFEFEVWFEREMWAFHWHQQARPEGQD